MLKIIYLANILVAGWISITSLFYPKTALTTVFENNFVYSESIRLVGALWFAIFLLSVLGLFFPEKMQLVLVFQVIYKSSWLLFAALPAMMNNQPYPKGMAITFIVWVVVLPFVIDWKGIFGVFSFCGAKKIIPLRKKKWVEQIKAIEAVVRIAARKVVVFPNTGFEN